jgi:predicted RNA binding protein YcfA (HicA-like mRNA interferase family)
MKVREILRLLIADAWIHISTSGSHRQYRHPTKRGKVTVAGKLSVNIPPGTLNSILNQAGLKGSERL